jgi:hypothetical protein
MLNDWLKKDNHPTAARKFREITKIVEKDKKSRLLALGALVCEYPVIGKRSEILSFSALIISSFL